MNKISFCVIASALVAIASGFVYIPHAVIGITIQHVFVLLAAGVLGGAQGASACGFFLALGALGAPVFAPQLYALTHGTFANTNLSLAFLSKTIEGSRYLGFFIASLVLSFATKNPTSKNNIEAKKIALAIIASLAIAWVLPIIKLLEAGLTLNEIVLALKNHFAIDALIATLLIPSVINLRRLAQKFLFVRRVQYPDDLGHKKGF